MYVWLFCYSPTQASPALPNDGSVKLGVISVSTSIFNVLEYPVACIPITRVNPALDSHLSGTSPPFTAWQSDQEASRGSWLVARELFAAYDAEKMKGLPVGVQVVTRPFQEEKAIGIMRLLDEALPKLEVRGGAWKDEETGKVNKGFAPGKWL